MGRRFYAKQENVEPKVSCKGKTWVMKANLTTDKHGCHGFYKFKRLY
jgi:hypothetical protein